MRFYPRQAKSRFDALAGPGHIGNHSPQCKAATSGASNVVLDRLIRYSGHLGSAFVSRSNILNEYGGTEG